MVEGLESLETYDFQSSARVKLATLTPNDFCHDDVFASRSKLERYVVEC